MSSGRARAATCVTRLQCAQVKVSNSCGGRSGSLMQA
jgi:hypothetical protein